MPADLPARAVSPRTSPPLTIVVLTKDEERDLPACLASVADLAAPIVVLDSGSTDRTVTIARAPPICQSMREGVEFPWPSRPFRASLKHTEDTQ